MVILSTPNDHNCNLLARFLAKIATMAEFGMHHSKTHLSELVARALAGEEIVITRRGEPAVRLVPERPAGGLASLRGAWKGKVKIAEDFDELPPEFAREFGID